MPATTTTTTFHLTAITDGSITKIHLGATERGNVAFCGVKLLVKGDTRFGGRYKDIVFTEVVKTSPEGSTDDSDGEPDLAKVDCGACKRSAAWKVSTATGVSVIGLPKAKAGPRTAPEAVSGSSVIEADPDTGLPRIKPEVAAKADAIAAAQVAKNAAGK